VKDEGHLLSFSCPLPLHLLKQLGNWHSNGYSGKSPLIDKVFVVCGYIPAKLTWITGLKIITMELLNVSFQNKDQQQNIQDGELTIGLFLFLSMECLSSPSFDHHVLSKHY
jgi:hypothetical protein